MKHLKLLFLIFMQYNIAASDFYVRKSYKNYKSYNIQGDPVRIERLKSKLQNRDVSIIKVFFY